ncbi:t-SNARE [Gymnopus androsaceus JB14]|uniref:t-SNARE n=1 Tax=Gymnopus androsaceus JB14 TaxID=1447944 RepID=A0A6A4HZ46_9AGAR|nr:t-SNARE [Gymnopus androsaceus JB14]
MSFQDIEAGFGPAASNNNNSFATPESPEDAAFRSLQSSLSVQILKMTANVKGIFKLVDQLGTGRDSAALRKSFLFIPHQKASLAKTSHDFQMSLVNFQRAQQLSAERQRTVVQGVKMAVEDHNDESEANEPSSSPSQRQAQLLQAQLSPHELAYQESLIQEREADIREIESGVHELAEIFRDLGTLVHQQGGMLDNIENNIDSVHVDTSRAAEELTQAHEYQRKAGRRAACLMLILIVVVAIVLLAVLS